MFAQAYCECILNNNKKHVWGAELAHSALSRKKGGCTPLHTVPVSPCPQEISLLTLPVFQGTAVSSEHFSQFFQPRNVAELRGLLPIWGSLEQLEWPSPAGPPLQGTELAAPEYSKYTRVQVPSKYTRGQS